MTSGPRQVIDISPIDSSSSGKLTTCDCEDFIGGTGGEVTHGLHYLQFLRGITSSNQTNQVFPSTRSKTLPSPVASVKASHDRHSPRLPAINCEGRNNWNDNSSQILDSKRGIYSLIVWTSSTRRASMRPPVSLR